MQWRRDRAGVDTVVLLGHSGGAIAKAQSAPDQTVVSMPGDTYFLQSEGGRDAVADVLTAWIGARFAI